MKNALSLFVCSLAPVVAAHGAVIDSGLLGGGLIPDNGGAVFRWTYAGDSARIAGLTLSVSISGSGGGGAFNGDLYATLHHSSGATTGFAVLLNRPGRVDAGAYGYDDNGITVTFDDSVTAPDIHDYRYALFGDHAAALVGPLSGTWATDGRAVDPDEVGSGSQRTTSLLDFLGMDPSGEWMLYIADVSAGGHAQLDSWRLQIDTKSAPVPEPAAGALLVALGLVGCAWMRRSRAGL